MPVLHTASFKAFVSKLCFGRDDDFWPHDICLFIGALGRVDGKGHFAPITVVYFMLLLGFWFTRLTKWGTCGDYVWDCMIYEITEESRSRRVWCPEWRKKGCPSGPILSRLRGVGRQWCWGRHAQGGAHGFRCTADRPTIYGLLWVAPGRVGI